MKKIRWATHKSLFGSIATSVCLVGGSAGLIFGVSAGTFKINYLNMNNAQARLKAAQSTNFYSQNISSQWNMYQKGVEGQAGYVKGHNQPLNPYFISDPEDRKSAPTEWWKELHGADSLPLYKDDTTKGINPSEMSLDKPVGEKIDDTIVEKRRQYGTLIIDGATHTAMDRSFNQSLFNGIANFNTNVPHDVKSEDEVQFYKPSQDNTQEFVNVYREAAKNTRVLCLAGFNHVTPLNALGTLKGDRMDFGDDKNIRDAGMLLIDGDVSNNQNMASVLFRSDQPAFLTGLATCMYFLNNLDVYHEGYRDLSVAAYGGTAIPTVTIYMGGFQRGVEFYNELILRRKVLEGTDSDLTAYFTKGHTSAILGKLIAASKYKTEIEELKGKSPKGAVVEEMVEKLYDEFSVKMIKLGDFGTHFSGSFAAGDAIGISKQLLNRGASAIIAVAGPQSLDTAQEIMNQNSKCIVIGVDCPMENSDYQKPFKNPAYKDKTVAPDKSTSAQASNIIKFSAVKDMTSVSEKILRNAAAGKNWDVTNDKPWKSTTPVPSWNHETEQINFADIWISYHEPTGGEENGTFDVIGLKALKSDIAHVLNIPTTISVNNKTYKLKEIRQPNAEEKASTGAENYFYFDATTLTGIDTLKISVTNEDDSVTLGANAFDYSKEGGKGQQAATEATLKNSGFKYVDFSEMNPSNIKLEDPDTPVFPGIADKQTAQSYNRGVIKFADSTMKDSDLANLVTDLFVGKTGMNNNWPLVEADPYKSICTFGFKTCGNIENGLISISWDGWAYLIDALKELEYYDFNTSAIVPFDTLWSKSAEQYWGELRGEIDPKLDEFLKRAIKATWDGSPDATGKPTVDALCTFNKDSIFYQNYSVTMAILGRFLNRAVLSFPKDMTIVLDKSGTPVPVEGDTPMTILTWLKYNMYFTV